jgi:hypothetical protein
MKFSGRRWLALIAVDILLRLLIWILGALYFFFLAPLFSCIHLVLLGLVAMCVSRFDLRPSSAFLVVVITTNVLFLLVTFGLSYAIAGSVDHAFFAFFGYAQVAFNVLLILVFWLDQRFGGDRVSSSARN